MTEKEKKEQEEERKKREEEYRLEQLNKEPYDEKYWHGVGVQGWTPRGWWYD